MTQRGPKIEKIFKPKPHYTEHYKEECFRIWYAAGRPSKLADICKVLPEDEVGRVPTTLQVGRWRSEFWWDVRADDLDAKAHQIVDDELVNQRALMLKAQASRGKELQEAGMKYLREKGFDTSASALQAVIRGASVEQAARGISERLVKLAELSNESLNSEIQKLVERIEESGEIIDMEEVDVDEDS